MKRKKLSHWSAGKKNPAGNALLKGLAAFAMLPYFIFCAIASLPLWATFMALKKKLKDKAFRNTAGFGVKLAMGPIVFALWAVLAFCLLEWPLALALSVLTIPSYSFFHDYIEFMRRWISDLRFMSDRKLKEEYCRICSRAEEMLGITR